MTDDSSPFVSAGYDRIVRIWDRATFTQKYGFTGHTGYINTVAISPDSLLVASGGSDHSVKMWDISAGKYLYSFNAGAAVNKIVFSPNRYWIAVATDESLKIFCLNRKACIADLKLQADTPEEQVEVVGEEKVTKTPKCLTCAFTSDGLNLFGGYSDSRIRCWNIPAQLGTSDK